LKKYWNVIFKVCFIMSEVNVSYNKDMYQGPDTHKSILNESWMWHAVGRLTSLSGWKWRFDPATLRQLQISLIPCPLGTAMALLNASDAPLQQSEDGLATLFIKYNPQ